MLKLALPQGPNHEQRVEMSQAIYIIWEAGVWGSDGTLCPLCSLIPFLYCSRQSISRVMLNTITREDENESWEYKEWAKRGEGEEEGRGFLYDGRLCYRLGYWPLAVTSLNSPGLILSLVQDTWDCGLLRKRSRHQEWQVGLILLLDFPIYFWKVTDKKDTSGPRI